MLPKLELHRDLPWRSHQAPGWTSGRAGRGTGGRSRETGEEKTLKTPDTSAHAWMIWNDTQGETLSHKCDV